MRNRTLSAISPLRPTNITNLTTGEVGNIGEFDEQVLCLLTYIQTSVKDYYSNQNNKQKLHDDITSSPPKFSPAEWARQRGYLLDTTPLPKEVKVKSRIQKLYQHKLISEVSGYVLNGNPRKQEPAFSQKINLGAVDKSMATLSLSGDVLVLRFKAWFYEYLVEYRVPEYVLKRDILKWSLPTIETRNGKPHYIFTIEENPKNRTTNNTQIAGLDLGRTEPYTISVTNLHGDRIAHYTATGRVRQLAHKRERLLVEKSFILTKADHYNKLGVNNDVLRREAKYKAGKARKLAQVIAHQVSAQITKKLLKHDLNTLAVEDLSWVHGAKYGSKWNHSQVLAKLDHSLSREGIRTKKINPHNTSQLCHSCGDRITPNSRKRTVHCMTCKTNLDRDLNASLNITKKLIMNRAPTQQSRTGNNYSHTRQIIEDKTSRSVPKKLTIAT